jgi:hypothetical protein
MGATPGWSCSAGVGSPASRDMTLAVERCPDGLLSLALESRKDVTVKHDDVVGHPRDEKVVAQRLDRDPVFQDRYAGRWRLLHVELIHDIHACIKKALVRESVERQ